MERLAKIAAFNYFRKTFQKWLLLLFIYLVYKNTYEEEVLENGKQMKFSVESFLKS